MATTQRWFRFTYENENLFKLEMGDNGQTWDKVIHIEENTHIAAIWSDIKKVCVTIFDLVLDDIGRTMNG